MSTGTSSFLKAAMTMTTKVVTTLINPSTINNDNDKGKEEIDKNETNTQRKKEQILSYHNCTGDHFVKNHFAENHCFDEVKLPMAFEKITASLVSIPNVT